MFNEELKNQYLQEHSDSEYTTIRVKRLFENLAEYEARWNADICTKSEQELRGVIEKVIGVRTSNRATVLSALRSYARWCISNDVPGACDGLLKIQDFGLENLQSSMVASPQHLQDILNRVFPPESERQLENIYRCFFWMAFMGIYEEDSVKITYEDIRPWSKTVEFDGIQYKIYEQAVPVFEHLSSATVLTCDFVRFKKVKDRAPGKLLLRGVKTGDELDLSAFRHSACREFRFAAERDPSIIRLNYRNVWLSGLFWRAYEAESNNEKYDFYDIIKGQYKCKKLPTVRRLQQINRDFEEDYQRWKAAFNK